MLLKKLTTAAAGVLLLALGAAVPAAVARRAPAPKPGPPRLLVAASVLTGNWEIYLIHPDTGETKNLTDHEAKDTEPCWSPDGKRIAFVSDRGGAPELWVTGADGTEPRAVSAGTKGCRWLRWSPDGERIAFVVPRADQKTEPEDSGDIYTVQVATGKVTRLTADKLPSAHPAWSPDGKTLAYTTKRVDAKWPLRTIGAGGGAVRDVGGAGGGTKPAWSPDGHRLAFVSLRSDRGYRVYTCDRDGGDVRDLGAAPGPADQSPPQWSPDGRTLAFEDWDDEKRTSQVATVGPDGTGLKVLTDEHSHYDPRWSPDGKSLCYGRLRKGPPEGDSSSDGFVDPGDEWTRALVVSDADGKNPRELLCEYYGGAEWRPR